VKQITADQTSNTSKSEQCAGEKKHFDRPGANAQHAALRRGWSTTMVSVIKRAASSSREFAIIPHSAALRRSHECCSDREPATNYITYELASLSEPGVSEHRRPIAELLLLLLLLLRQITSLERHQSWSEVWRNKRTATTRSKEAHISMNSDLEPVFNKTPYWYLPTAILRRNGHTYLLTYLSTHSLTYLLCPLDLIFHRLLSFSSVHL